MERRMSLPSPLGKGVLAIGLLCWSFGLWGQTRPAEARAAGSTGVILVDTDDRCGLLLDGKDQGVVEPDEERRISVTLGEHVLKCMVEGTPDLVWRKVVEVKSSQQVAALISLKALHIQYDEAVAKLVNRKALAADDKGPLPAQSIPPWEDVAHLDFNSLRIKAWAGDAAAETEFGLRYEQGRGVAQDYAQALQWYQKAADQGNANAQSYLGSVYFYGHGVQQDYAQARQWQQKAADQGNAGAEASLGFIYEQGRGVKPDLVEARRWFQKAADQGFFTPQLRLELQINADKGNTQAQETLGIIYENGLGVAKDNKQAQEWYRKAADAGDTFAKDALNRLSTVAGGK